MRYLRHEYILLAASAAATLTYFSLRRVSFSMDAALCAGFTVVVLSYALRKRGHSFFSGDDPRSITEVVFAHTVCLAALVMAFRTGMFESSLPTWFTIPVGADSYGRQLGPSGFQMLQAIGIFFLGYFEFRVLTDPKPRDPEKEEKKATAALWKKAALEAERMDGLRLR
jgi:hypothetical protein